MAALQGNTEEEKYSEISFRKTDIRKKAVNKGVWGVSALSGSDAFLALFPFGGVFFKLLASILYCSWNVQGQKPSFFCSSAVEC